MFSKETEDKFEHLVSIYPRKRSALIPMLLLAQKEDGYISNETVDYVAKYLDLNPSEVDSILSFYTLLRRKAPRPLHDDELDDVPAPAIPRPQPARTNLRGLVFSH